MMLCEPCQPRELRGRYCTLRNRIKHSYQFWRLGLSVLCTEPHDACILPECVVSFWVTRFSQCEEVEANQSPSDSWRWLSRLQSQQHRFLEYFRNPPPQRFFLPLCCWYKYRDSTWIWKKWGGVNTSCKDWKSFINKVNWSEMVIN